MYSTGTPEREGGGKGFGTKDEGSWTGFKSGTGIVTGGRCTLQCGETGFEGSTSGILRGSDCGVPMLLSIDIVSLLAKDMMKT
jgi:hypothetical protein